MSEPFMVEAKYQTMADKAKLDQIITYCQHHNITLAAHQHEDWIVLEFSDEDDDTLDKLRNYLEAQ